MILLQTARAMAINETEQVLIRILLDSGSQLSYVHHQGPARAFTA